MDDVRKKFPNHKIGIEAKSGRMLTEKNLKRWQKNNI